MVATYRKLSESSSCEITERNLVEYNLDAIADKMSFYFLAAACKSTVFDIVRHVPVAWRQLLRRRANTPRAKQLAEPLGLFVKWERDAEGLFIDFKGFLGRRSVA